MDLENAKRLQNYVKSASKRRVGVSVQEPSGSGPGGAAATNKRISSAAAKASDMPGYRGKYAALKEDVAELKMSSDTRDMGDVAGLYNRAAATIKKATGRRKRFKDI